MTSKARDQPGVSSVLRSSAARIWLSHSAPSWRPFGSWSPRSQRDREAITLVDARLHPRLKSSHRAPGFGEPLGNLDFELCDLMLDRGHPGHHVTRQQTQSELARVLKNDRVVDRQAE
jgi:hypothetical protein